MSIPGGSLEKREKLKGELSFQLGLEKIDRMVEPLSPFVHVSTDDVSRRDWGTLPNSKCSATFE
jgi:hypothetical protein